jgi:biuret amidohydrolase
VTDHEMLQEMIAGKNNLPIALDPARTALVIVDVQRFFTRSDSAFAVTINAARPGLLNGYLERVKGVLSRIQELQGAFRAQQKPVLFCVVGSEMKENCDLTHSMRNFDDFSAKVIGRRAHPAVNDWYWQMDDAVAPLPGEPIVNKKSFGALASTGLDQTLHNAGVNSVVVCGLTTAVCVGQTARELADRGFRVVIADDACTEISPEMHEAALLSFCHVFGQARDTADIVSFLEAAIETPLAAKA